MKVFDIHSDLLFDLYRASNRKDHERFSRYHVANFLNSPVVGGIWTMYSPIKFDLLDALIKGLSEIKPELLPGFQFVFGLEGLRNLKIEDLDKIYNLGIRHATLTWNEENIYATGIKGRANRGLTKLGKRLLSRMEELDMIIDLAHLNEKSFFDVLKYTNKNIIFSHGNLREFSDVSRNLSLEQMKVLKEADGLLGLTLVKKFISRNPKEQNLDYFLNHIDRAVEIMGIDNLAFGFDFMDYFPNNDNNLDEIPDVTGLDILLDAMRNRGYLEEDIQKIAYDNFYNRFHDKITLIGGENEGN